jgi:hypothetical protein
MVEERHNKNSSGDPEADPGSNNSATEAAVASPAQKELGGREGPDPTRYGDWEKAGRCIDF